MKQQILLLSFYCASFCSVYGQQDPMHTQYMFNKLAYNPACAGSNEHLAFNLIHRKQWTGIDGAPATQAFSAHTSLRNERIGVGLSLGHDKIGPSGVLDVYASYAYRMALGGKLKLAVGVQGGVSNWYARLSEVVIQHGSDQVYQSNFSRWMPNFGVGAYLSNDRFYIGMGCPRLLEYDLRKTDSKESIEGKSYRHYYSTIGAAFPLGAGNVIFRPSALLKSTGWFSSFRANQSEHRIGAPTAIDLDASFFFYETFWIGAAFRTAFERGISSDDSADLWAAWYLRNGLRFGVSYDIVLSKLRAVTGGSYELMVGYEFDIKVKKVASVRYF